MSEADVWNRFAGRYDSVVRLFDHSYPEVRRRLSRDVPQGSRVLEIAAGTGQFTIALARRAGEVIATDISPEMAERLAAHVEQSGWGSVDCLVMSAYDIDAPDASFDVVVCANALHVMTDPAVALGEFGRVLRAGGCLIAPTFLHGADILRVAISRALSAFSPFVAHTRFDLQALQATIEDQGFEVTAAEQLPGLFPLAYVVARRIGECPVRGVTDGRALR